jgi:hypothetical protein
VDEEYLAAMATAFLAGYNRPDIWKLSESRLVIPTGFGRLWWGIRTEYVPAGSLRAVLPSRAKAWTQGWRPWFSPDLQIKFLIDQHVWFQAVQTVRIPCLPFKHSF